MNSKLNFSFAAPPDPGPKNAELQKNVAGVPVQRETVLYDFTKLQEPIDPLVELERYLGSATDFGAIHHKGQFNETERKFFDFNWWIERNRQYEPEFAAARLISIPGYQDTALSLVWKVRQRYDACAHNGQFKTVLPYLYRLRTLYFWMWYTVLGLNVERVNEFNHFIELMDTACCGIQLENVSLCVQVLAGQEADDRDTFLAKLRPHFQKHLARIQSKVITCNCAEGIGGA